MKSRFENKRSLRIANDKTHLHWKSGLCFFKGRNQRSLSQSNMGPDTSHHWVVYFIPNKFPKQPRHVLFFQDVSVEAFKGEGVVKKCGPIVVVAHQPTAPPEV